MHWLDWIIHRPLHPVTLLSFVAAVLTSLHAIRWKRDSRAAVLWLVVIWLVPYLGPVLYVLLGVNRLSRSKVLARSEHEGLTNRPSIGGNSKEQLLTRLPSELAHLAAIANTENQLLSRPLAMDSRVELLINGDEAYPAMLHAIAQARHTLSISSYIFDRDEVGLIFARALGDAVKRGVEVRVLLDATGAHYSWPTILKALRREGVRSARFLPTFSSRRLPSINLRNHRKLLVIDGSVGFTGGMNIRSGHWLEKNPAYPVRDLHFQMHGPVVAHLQEVFADDWFYTTGESLRGPAWFPPLTAQGPVIARGIADGPDEDFETLRWTLLAALTAAKSSVRIATPYFLPDPTLIDALNLAALRGVRVDILLPEKGNLPIVQWASRAQWWQVLSRGCHLWLSPPPFDHSKLFVVDDAWGLIGSANWDPRSLRLNFEFNVECYDPALAGTLARWFDGRLRESRLLTLAEIDARPSIQKLGDGLARLFTPYL